MHAREHARGREADCRQFFDTLGTFVTVLAIKLYRLRLDPPRAVPSLPCLDHEAMLHERIAPHAAAWIKTAVDRLQTVSALMEKQSRVASWGARTVMTPFIAVAGFLSYQFLGTFAPRLGTMAWTCCATRSSGWWAVSFCTTG